MPAGDENISQEPHKFKDPDVNDKNYKPETLQWIETKRQYPEKTVINRKNFIDEDIYIRNYAVARIGGLTQKRERKH